MNCPHCQHENREGRRFCSQCGSRLPVVCPSCGALDEEGERFCGQCGAELVPAASPSPAAPHRDPRSYTPKHLADKILQSKSALEGERKQVTVLFADVKGSMELAEQVDPEEWHGILDRFFQILADGVHRFEGTVNQYTGDGIMALFGAPIGHEDHAQRACYAALHLRQELRSYGEELKRTRGLNFSVRMGINSGEVVVGRIGDDLRMDYTAQGQVVNLAQRLEQLADPGMAYLTDPTARLVEGFVQLRDLGEFQLKGLFEPMRVHELEGVGPARTRLDAARLRGFTRFVGRRDEMAVLEAALQRAVEGHGQVVGVVGEAGVGKSRLCAEFVERRRANGTRLLEAHCPAYGRSVPLLPILGLLRDSFAITPQDSDQLAREKIAGRLFLLDEAFRDALPLVFDFLGVPDPDQPGPQIDPDLRQRQLFAFVRRLVQARSEKEPAVLFFDDLHWIDAGSEEFLAQVVEATGSTRTLLLLNFRPEYTADWMRKSYYQQLPLTPLSPQEVAEMITDLLGSDASVAPLPALIQERAGGNPFFTEEVVLSLVESGDLEGERGSYRLIRSIKDLEVPATVQALLAARIDRLPEQERQVLQTAAVIGREFSEPLLSAVVELSAEDLSSSLSRLQASEFIVEQAIYPVAKYAFKHSLTEQVARESQLQDRRRRIHDAVAHAIEQIESDRLDEQAAVLAHHWGGAGQPLIAARWHRRAAEWTRATHAGESLRHWQEIRRLLDQTPETDETIDLGVEARERILLLLIRWVGVDQDEAGLLEEGRELARRSRDPRVQLRFPLTVGVYRLYRGEIRDSIATLEEAKSLADDLGDPSLQLGIGYFLAIALGFAGAVTQALRAMDESQDLLERGAVTAFAPFVGYSPQVAVVGLRGYLLAKLGRFSEADVCLARAIEEAHQRGDVTGIAVAESWASMASGLKGNARQALAHGRRGVEAAEKALGASLLGNAHWALGLALLLNGRANEAVEEFERASEIGTWLFRLAAMPSLPLAYLGQGDPERAQASAEESIATALDRGAKDHELTGRLALVTVLLRTHGAAARERVEAELVAAQSLIETSGDHSRQPLVHEARAELARLLGDDATRDRELRQAHSLFVEMGATGHVQRLEKELGL